MLMTPLCLGMLDKKLKALLKTTYISSAVNELLPLICSLWNLWRAISPAWLKMKGAYFIIKNLRIIRTQFVCFRRDLLWRYSRKYSPIPFGKFIAKLQQQRPWFMIRSNILLIRCHICQNTFSIRPKSIQWRRVLMHWLLELMKV